VTDSPFLTLEAAIDDENSPNVDLMLRRGRHIGRDDGPAYDYLVDAQAVLEDFYRRFGCELVQQGDGYFYLLLPGDRLGHRQLSAGEMLVGQTLALLYLDPATLQHGGIVGREVLLQRLSGLLGTDVLVRTLNPRKRKYDERIAAETVRTQVGEALRRLRDLGFVDLVDEVRLRLRPALMRFAEPVRGLEDPNAALERLVARGEVLLEETGDEDDDPGDEEPSRDPKPTTNETVNEQNTAARRTTSACSSTSARRSTFSSSSPRPRSRARRATRRITSSVARRRTAARR
jgi:chromosome partition protein MukE